MPRNDYILSALKDLKEHVEKLDDKFDKRLSNIEDKLHRSEIIAEKQSQNLQVNNESLDKHMKRTDLSDQRQDVVEVAMERISGRVEHLESIAEVMKQNHSEAMNKFNEFSTWIIKQQERTKGVKLFWNSTFVWIKRIGVAATSLAAVYGGYEIIQKVFQK